MTDLPRVHLQGLLGDALAANVENIVVLDNQYSKSSNDPVTGELTPIPRNIVGNSLDNVIDASRLTDWSPAAVRLDGGAGADTFVAGSAIYDAGKESDPHRYDSAIAAMRAQLATV